MACSAIPTSRSWAASGARLGSPPGRKSDTDLEAAGSRRSTDEAMSSGYARRQARERDIGRSGPNPLNAEPHYVAHLHNCQHRPQ
jgi:hypothetical protein